jgi:hypothetical protein
MRCKLLVTFILLFAGVYAFSQEQNALVGTWKLVSMKWSKGDSTGTIEGTTTNHIKIITPTHYATLTQNLDGSFRRAMGGKAKFDATSYTEMPTHGTNVSSIGSVSTFNYEIKGDKMHSYGNGSGGYYFDEIWQRAQ